ncbi:hypothetical protein DVH24_002938 [Malus domestica]|uniref:Uncharacterized protein n=1 Tax=Malus domestica TaxID=3750 RepID=A0A498K3T7_MALDO|nr:hypothetical protein DVH24_002938 [Malus domestica]
MIKRGEVLESNLKEIEEHGDNKNIGMSIEDSESCFTLLGKRPLQCCLFGQWFYQVKIRIGKLEHNKKFCKSLEALNQLLMR